MKSEERASSAGVGAPVAARLQAIRAQIEIEKTKLGSGAGKDGGELVEEIGTYEELQTELQFAEQAYTSAKGALDVARTEARRQTRYLAAHIEPTVAQSSQYPGRYTLSAIAVGLLILVWGLLTLVYYNIGDRR